MDQADEREKLTPTIAELGRAVDKWKNNKSAGSDKILSNLIKEGGESLINTK